MQIGKMLPDDEFKARIVPILSALFASSDPTIRSTLLENIPQFAALLTEQVVEANIFPQVSSLIPSCHAVHFPTSLYRRYSCCAALGLVIACRSGGKQWLGGACVYCGERVSLLKRLV